MSEAKTSPLAKVALVVALVAIVIIVAFGDELKSPPRPAFRAELDCEAAIRGQLKDRRSGEFERVQVTPAEPGFAVVGIIRAKNSFGAFTDAAFECRWAKGQVISAEIVQ